MTATALFLRLCLTLCTARLFFITLFIRNVCAHLLVFFLLLGKLSGTLSSAVGSTLDLVSDVESDSAGGGSEQEHKQNQYARAKNYQRAYDIEQAINKLAQNSTQHTAATQINSVIPQRRYIKANRALGMHGYNVYQRGHRKHCQQRKCQLEGNESHINVFAPENGKVEQYQRQKKYRPAEKSAKDIVYPPSADADGTLRLKQIDAQEKRRQKHAEKAYYKRQKLMYKFR